ncbi:unnamed protein product [Phyllotreta striolata]|uniref:Cytochrome P450 monooxygenase n=1 Tax=Phyllotreta striolata TaxID=444603 RepID=A0A9N9TFM2_PHYSR|nr:unnamed protein product [Phyllotreta striolata]
MLEYIICWLTLLFVLPIYLHNRFVRKNDKYLKNMSGPRPNAYFGNMLEFYGPTYKLLDVLSNFIKKYGGTTKLYYGPFKMAVITSDEKFVEFIMNSNKTVKGDQYLFFRNWTGDGLFISSGKKWKARRRMLTPAFHFTILENFVDIFESCGDVLLKNLESYDGRESFDINKLITLYALDVICESSMGTKLNAQMNGEPQYVEAAKLTCQIIVERGFSPLHPVFYPFTYNFYRERKALKVLHSYSEAVIDQKMQEMNDSTENQSEQSEDDIGIKKKVSFLDLLLRATCDGKPLSKADIRDEVDTFMFAGHDTVASTISFTLHALANNPSVQQKTLEEQIEMFGDIKSAKPTYADLQDMKYLDMVIKESMRMYAPVPLFVRKTTEEFEWEGNVFPKDLTITIFPYLIHRSEEYYEDPMKFIPERFLDVDGKHPYRFIPFSSGPRNCIGQKFAMAQLKSILSKIVRNFELLPANPNPELKIAPEIILVSKNGVPVRIRKRD